MALIQDLTPDIFYTDMELNSKFSVRSEVVMSNQFDSLLKTDEEIKQDVIRDFTNELLHEAKKLADKYGKEDFLKMIKLAKTEL